MKKILFFILLCPLFALGQQLPPVNDTVRLSGQGAVGTLSGSYGFDPNGNFISYIKRGTSTKYDFYPSGAYLRRYFASKTNLQLTKDSLVNLYTEQIIGGNKTATGNWIYTGTINVRSGSSYPFVGMSQADGVYSFADANNNVALYRGYLAFSQAGTPSAKTLSIKAPVSISSGGRVQTLQDKDGTIALLGDVPTTGKLDSTYATIDNPSLLKYNYIGGNVNTMFSASVSGWDQVFGEFGNTKYYNGKIYQFYTGFIAPETETNVHIGLRVSSDGGKTWVKGGPLGDGQIIARAGEDPYCEFDVATNTAYLLAEDKEEVPFRRIMFYTSPLNDLVNWTQRTINFDIGAPGSWEETDVSSPAFVIKNGIVKMYYEGRGGPNGATQGGAIGLATAPLGLTLNFTKFSGNPILIGTQLANTPGFTVGNRGVVNWATAVVPDAIVQNNGKYYTTFHGSEQLFPNTTNFVAGIAVSDTSMQNMRDNLDSWLKTSKATDYNGKGVNLVLDSGEYKVYYIDTALKVVRRGQLTNQASADFRDKYLYFGAGFMRYLPTDTASTNTAMFRNPTTRQLVTRSLYASDVKNIWGPVFTNSDAGYVADFNNVVNTQPGYPRYLMLGTATNAPPNSSGSFFYINNIELGATKDGTHNLFQKAIGYGNTVNKNFARTRIGGVWSTWLEDIDGASTQTLSNKTLISPKLNTTSAVGQVWTADGSNNGSGAWLTPSNIFNGVIFNNNQVAPNTTDQRPFIYSTSGTGSGRYAAAGNLVLQGRPNAALGVSIATGTAGTERVFVIDASTTIKNTPILTSITSGVAGTDSLLVKNALTNAVGKVGGNSYVTAVNGVGTSPTFTNIKPATTYQSSTGTTADSISTVSSQRHVSKALVGGNGIGIVQTATSVTISATGNPVVEISGTSQAASANTVYIPHNAALTLITIPTTTTIGTLYQTIGEGAGGWRMTLPAGAVAVGVGGFTTTAGGSLSSTDRYCTITIRYAATNKFVVTTSQGTITPL